MDSLRALLVAALAATAAIAPCAHALPSEPRSAEGGAGTFTLAQVRNENFQGQDGLKALLRAYAKYNASLTPQLRMAVQMNPAVAAQGPVKRGSVTGSAAATPPRNYDYEFVTPIEIGTPAQKLNVVIDTGSADFWLLSTDTSPSGLAGQPIYHPAKSTTSKLQKGQTWSITYGDGTGASGITYTDVVSLGQPAVKAVSQIVESAKSVSPSIGSDGAMSGLMGLGMTSGNTVRPGPQKTFMDNVRGSLKAPLFAADLRAADPSGKVANAGTYDFGYVDAKKYTGTMQYVPVSMSSIYWQFMASGYSIGSGSGAKYEAKPWKVIADTGTSLLLLPDDMVKAYYAKVAGAGADSYVGGMVFPCKAKLPDFSFGIGFYRGVVPGRYMSYASVNSTHCFGGIQSSEGIGFSIFGDVLLKAQYVVFDLGNMKLGWANKKLLT